VYTVWYGTDRAPLDPANPAAGFGTARADSVSYGTCAVNIPRSHKFGSLGSSWWKRLLRGQDDRLKLEQVTALASARFWQAVGEELQRWDEDERQALVYVHGFNVEFSEAALRAAQIGFDLKVPGVMAFFSWPSRGAPDKYPADEATIETSEAAIAEFLVRFANDVGARRVHVLAHSMGNRGLLRAMQRIQAEAAARSRAKFGQIILAAPDVDARLFKDLARLYPSWSERTTLYASPGDRAVGLSRWLHDAARAGFTPPVTVVPGIDTVEVPDLDLDLLGHSYYAEAEGVLHDMFDLLRRNADPDDRQQLERLALPGGETYWRLTPA
jgi:esterase/lipase superfamily enzyme